MDADFSSFRNRTEAGWRAPPDFRVLVAFLAGAQAAQPTARIACRLGRDEDAPANHAAALIEIFAPRGAVGSAAASLKGRFHLGVPFSHPPVTAWQAS